jgi:ABC-type dipeptide/oligopeptide/nickel transport system permease subunit
MTIGAGFIVINLLTDLSYALIDPRLRGNGAAAANAGPGWRACAPWLAAAAPWFGLAASVVLARAGRAEAASALLGVCGTLVVVELVLAAVLPAVRRNLRFGIAPGWSAVRQAAGRGAEKGLAALGDYAAFVRRHRPAAVGLGLVAMLAMAALFAPWIAPYDPMQGTGQFNAPADRQFWLGSDPQGRDLFSRLVWGARYTLLIALAATFVSLAAGTAIGAAAGFFGGAVDTLFMRATDFAMSFPSFLLAVVTAAVLGKSLENLMWAVGFIGIPVYARQMRAEVLRVKALDFVDASRSLGAGPMRILFKTVVPNCLTPLIVLATLGIGGAILDVAGLAFLGLGGDPFIPEWGLILKLGWDESAKGAFQVTVAGACILVAVLGFNLLGDGLRDWLDPRMRR